MKVHYTPTHKRMLKVLSDGMPHKKEELHKCLDDDLASVSCVRKHLSTLRSQLKKINEDVICEYKDRSFFYRHIVLLSLQKS